MGCIYLFILYFFPRYMSRNGIARSYGNSVFSFFKDTLYSSPWQLHQFTFPPTLPIRFSFPSSLLPLDSVIPSQHLHVIHVYTVDLCNSQFHVCTFLYLLSCICDPPVNTCGIFMVTCKYSTQKNWGHMNINMNAQNRTKSA